MFVQREDSETEGGGVYDCARNHDVMQQYVIRGTPNKRKQSRSCISSFESTRSTFSSKRCRQCVEAPFACAIARLFVHGARR